MSTVGWWDSQSAGRPLKRQGKYLQFTSAGGAGGSGGSPPQRPQPACQRRRRKTRGSDPWVNKIPWRRARQPTAVFLPGESYGQRSLVGYSSWGHEESDTSEATEHSQRKGKTARTSLWCFCFLAALDNSLREVGTVWKHFKWSRSWSVSLLDSIRSDFTERDKSEYTREPLFTRPAARSQGVTLRSTCSSSDRLHLIETSVCPDSWEPSVVPQSLEGAAPGAPGPSSLNALKLRTLLLLKNDCLCTLKDLSGLVSHLLAIQTTPLYLYAQNFPRSPVPSVFLPCCFLLCQNLPTEIKLKSNPGSHRQDCKSKVIFQYSTNDPLKIWTRLLRSVNTHIVA